MKTVTDIFKPICDFQNCVSAGNITLLYLIPQFNLLNFRFGLKFSQIWLFAQTIVWTLATLTSASACGLDLALADLRSSKFCQTPAFRAVLLYLTDTRVSHEKPMSQLRQDSGRDSSVSLHGNAGCDYSLHR